MLLFFLFIALANLALGYWAAVKFHAALFPEPASELELVRGPADPALLVPPFSVDASQMPLVPREPPLVALPPELAARTTPAPTLDVAEALRPTIDAAPTMLPANSGESAAATLAAETRAAEAPPREAEAAAETSIPIEDFMKGLQEFRSRLSALDERVRQCTKAPDSRDIQSCVDDFRAANSQYLERSTEAAELLQQAPVDEGAGMASVRQTVQQAIASQAEEVRKTESELSQIDVSDAEASCETLLRTAGELAATNDILQANLEEAQQQLELVQAAPVAEPELVDARTQLPSRAAFAAQLSRHCQGEIAFSTSLVDLDHCDTLTEDNGQQVVDGILASLGQIVASTARGDNFAARYGASQFAVLYPAHTAEECALAAEQIRQVVEKTNFTHDGKPLTVTASVVIVPCRRGEGETEIGERIEAAVAAARRFGRNRTFQFVDGDVEPVLPADLDIQSNDCEV